MPKVYVNGWNVSEKRYVTIPGNFEYSRVPSIGELIGIPEDEGGGEFLYLVKHVAHEPNGFYPDDVEARLWVEPFDEEEDLLKKAR